MPNAEAKFYSIDDLASLFGCSTKKVRRMIKCGDIGHYRFGRLIRISQADLDRYIQNCRAIETKL